jgi:formate dehydrogenase major subunit
MRRLSLCQDVKARPTRGVYASKGRYGFDYIDNPERLVAPLIRREDVPKSASMPFDPANPLTHFREASWDEALDLAASRLAEVRDTYGPAAMAGFGSAKGTNEEAYLVQKLVRTGFRTNNVDHCTRLCHASSVAALLENIGSGRRYSLILGMPECRSYHRDRCQPDSQSSGCGDLYQERGGRRRTVVCA